MDVFGAIADPLRRDLVGRLARGPARVVDLAADHTVSRPAISKHLRLLGEAGLVAAEDHGRERHYRLVEAGLEPVRAWVDGLVAGPRIPEQTLDALDLEVRRAGRDRRTNEGAVAPTETTDESRRGETG